MILAIKILLTVLIALGIFKELFVESDLEYFDKTWQHVLFLVFSAAYFVGIWVGDFVFVVLIVFLSQRILNKLHKIYKEIV